LLNRSIGLFEPALLPQMEAKRQLHRSYLGSERGIAAASIPGSNLYRLLIVPFGFSELPRGRKSFQSRPARCPGGYG
jgi:hypothetical protein